MQKDKGIMISSKDKQIGGDHYKTDGPQHWDVVDHACMGYYEAVATKYVIRWENKDGVRDLEKALHYVEKCLEEHLSKRGRLNRACEPEDKAFSWSTYCIDNNIPHPENRICMLLMNWRHRDELNEIIKLINQLIGAAIIGLNER